MTSGRPTSPPVHDMRYARELLLNLWAQQAVSV
jgi:hypothetical protein